MIYTLEEAIYNAIWGEIEGKLHTSIPGIVSKYDPSKPSVEVQPAVKKIWYDGTELSLPIIVSVPIVFPRTKRFHLSYPIEKNDCVLLLFTERSIEEYIQNGTEVTPTNTRIYSMTDAVAIPGFFGFGKGSQISDGKKLEIIFDTAKIISDGKTFEFTGDVKINGKVESTGDIKANGKSMDNHTHPFGTLASPYGPANPFTGSTGVPS
jgi:hypothetical protein